MQAASVLELAKVVMAQGLPKKVPVEQVVQSDRRADPVPGVARPAVQARQNVEAGLGWYLLTGQEVQALASTYLPA